jgi:hypothetical protein
MIHSVRQIILGLLLFAAVVPRTYAQGTVFTYQGQLSDGGLPANGTNYGMTFYLYDAPTNGDLEGTYPVTSVTVTNGVFTVPLDFGNVFDGTPRWLQVAVQTNGGDFSTLWPRQMITATPYAIMAGSASNLLGVLPASQVAGAISPAQLPISALTNQETGVTLQGGFTGTFGGVFEGVLQDFNDQLPTTLSNLNAQVATPINLGGGTNFNASQIAGGTWTNASVNYAYQSFYTNYTTTTNDVVLDCTGTNQVITLLPAANFPPTWLLTVWSDNVNGSVIITNGTGSEAITVPGQGQGLAVLLGPANSPSNSVTLMVHGGHW